MGTRFSGISVFVILQLKLTIIHNAYQKLC